MKSREEHSSGWEWQPWPSPATNDTASLCGMRDEELWFVGCECLPLLPSSPLPPPRPPLVNGGACGRVFAFYPALSTEPSARIPDTLPGLSGYSGRNVPILPTCPVQGDPTYVFPTPIPLDRPVLKPFKVHFTCNYGAELLKQKWREGKRGRGEKFLSDHCQTDGRTEPLQARRTFAPLFRCN